MQCQSVSILGHNESLKSAHEYGHGHDIEQLPWNHFCSVHVCACVCTLYILSGYPENKNGTRDMNQNIVYLTIQLRIAPSPSAVQKSIHFRTTKCTQFNGKEIKFNEASTHKRIQIVLLSAGRAHTQRPQNTEKQAISGIFNLLFFAIWTVHICWHFLLLYLFVMYLCVHMHIYLLTNIAVSWYTSFGLEKRTANLVSHSRSKIYQPVGFFFIIFFSEFIFLSLIFFFNI